MSVARSGSGALAAFASRDFRFYAASRFLATVAVNMQSVAVGFQLYALTHRPLDLGYVGLAQFLPVFLLSLVAGQAADRFDRRRLGSSCGAVYVAASLVLWGVTRFGAATPGAIYTALVAVGIARAFYGPSVSALLPSIVPREHFANAATLQSSSWQFAAIGGPSLGGALYAIAGSAEPVYAAAVIAFALSTVLMLFVKTRTGRMEKKATSLSTVFAGIRYVRKARVLLGSISLDFFAVFLGGAVALLPVFATDILHVGALGLGFLRAAPSLGAGIMAVLLAFFPIRQRAGKKMLACVAIFGVATIVFGLSHSFVLSLVALVVLGAADMVSVVVRMTLEQAATPDAMRGRVSAVNMLFVGASNELGEFESGVAAAALGTIPAVIAGGVGTLIVVGLWALLFPALRDVDRAEAVTPIEIDEPTPRVASDAA